MKSTVFCSRVVRHAAAILPFPPGVQQASQAHCGRGVGPLAQCQQNTVPSALGKQMKMG